MIWISNKKCGQVAKNNVLLRGANVKKEKECSVKSTICIIHISVSFHTGANVYKTSLM